MTSPTYYGPVRLFRPPIHAVSELESLLPQAEIVVLILPSTAESHHLIDRRQLSLLRQGALLVNAARGRTAPLHRRRAAA